MLKLIFQLLRIKQWIKNAFVLAPLLFSLRFVYVNDIIASLKTFIIFCLSASFVYIINDLLDAKQDSLHPRKRNRPIASGKISKHQALFTLLLLTIVIFCGCCFLNNIKVIVSILLYIILNIFYSLFLKRIVIIDVFAIALGFILRVYAGAYAISCPVSSFIFMTTLFLALFLGFCKRYGEIIACQQSTRNNLHDYNPLLLNIYIAITSTLTIMSYALYTLEGRTIDNFATNRLVYSIFFVVYGILRYIYMLNLRKNIDDPTENLYRDKTLAITCVLFVLYLLALYTKII